MKKHNFNAGPSILADEVIENAAKAVLDFNGSGLSILSISHRTKDFDAVMEEADALFRESYLVKGMDGVEPAEIAALYDECCLLFGLPGQTRASMEKDIRTGLAFFERVCINIMEENTAPIKPDPAVIDIFKKELFPLYKDEPRVDILLQNTGFGVGGCLNGGEDRD